jgi:pimeloyl-ACP methyl ester carboxylesterase
MTGKWEQGNILTNGIRIHYYRTGGCKPQVVLNHGALDDGLCWTRVAEALEGDYDLILLDARGHGFSEIVHLAGAGHDIRRSRLEGYLAALRSFLAEIYS